jgi:hypothetical protein
VLDWQLIEQLSRVANIKCGNRSAARSVTNV